MREFVKPTKTTNRADLMVSTMALDYPKGPFINAINLKNTDDRKSNSKNGLPILSMVLPVGRLSEK